MVKDSVSAEVQYSFVKFSLRLGDISVQSKTTTLDVDTSFKNNLLFRVTAASHSYCPLSQAGCEVKKIECGGQRSESWCPIC